MENNPHQEPATPAEIWEILRVLSKEQQASSKERQAWSKERKEETQAINKQMEETDRRMKETDRQLKETRKLVKETGEQMKETDRQLKRLGRHFDSQWGKLMESLVEGDLVPLLQERKIAVQSTYTRMNGRRNGEHYEYDILAVSGAEVVVVEVKTTLRAEDVTHFLSKLRKFTAHAPIYKGKNIFGAVAYLKADSSVVVHAERQGLYVIRATGSSASIVNPTDFQPRVFH